MSDLLTRLRRLGTAHVLTGSAIAVAALVVVSAASYRGLLRLERDAAARDLTNVTLLRLDNLLAHLLDAEAGERGYLVTGKDSYLEPFRKALARTRQDIEALRAPAAADTALAAALGRLAPLVAANPA